MRLRNVCFTAELAKIFAKKRKAFVFSTRKFAKVSLADLADFMDFLDELPPTLVGGI